LIRARLDQTAGRLRAWRFQRALAGRRLLGALGDDTASVFFVEVGANDGTRHDHLRPFILSRAWRGIMVEPVPYIFERLRRNYGGIDGVVLENVAIADRDGVLPFYHVVDATDAEREHLPHWYDQIGSFSRDVILSHARDIPDIEQRIARAQVPCMTFESLCRRHLVTDIDLLVIDTEGYDHEIVKSIDFSTRRPRLLVYEHYHLSAEDRAACRQRVQQLGYRTLAEGFDTWCVDFTRQDRLTRAWKRLRPGIRAQSADETVRVP
jgi:FkbM family methyltransferase